MSLQGFLFSWLLVGVLDRPADEAGYARTIAEIPPLVVLLLGGLLGDRVEGRRYLSWMHVFMAVPPLLIAVVFVTGNLDYRWVVLFGVLMAAIQALSDPARQSIISRVARLDIQRAVTIMTIFTSGVGLAGFYLGGRLETFGLNNVLIIQSGLFLLGLLAVLRLPALPMPPARTPSVTRQLAAGFRGVWQHSLVRDIIGLNFVSSLFNAGAYIVAIPYIVTDVYLGDASFFATVMIIFTAGSMSSNLGLLAFMPLKRPGRLFLLLQLTRMVIMTVLVLKPDIWVFYAAIFAWGLNMGITTTLVRTTVQELADPDVRAQILSVLLLSFMVASPISASMFGLLITNTTPLMALVPGIGVSVLIFIIGRWFCGLWGYRSDQGVRRAFEFKDP